MPFGDRSGSTAVEFAFVLWPFLALIFAIFDLGHYMLAQYELGTLAGEVARSVIISCGSNNHGQLSASCTTNPLTTAQEQFIAPVLFAGSASPTITVMPGGGIIAVTVSISNVPTILPLWGDLFDHLSATTKLYY